MWSGALIQTPIRRDEYVEFDLRRIDLPTLSRANGGESGGARSHVDLEPFEVAPPPRHAVWLGTGDIRAAHLPELTVYDNANLASIGKDEPITFPLDALCHRL